MCVLNKVYKSILQCFSFLMFWRQLIKKDINMSLLHTHTDTNATNVLSSKIPLHLVSGGITHNRVLAQRNSDCAVYKILHGLKKCQ